MNCFHNDIKVDLICAFIKQFEAFLSKGLLSMENHFKKIDYSYNAKIQNWNQVKENKRITCTVFTFPRSTKDFSKLNFCFDNKAAFLSGEYNNTINNDNNTTKRS